MTRLGAILQSDQGRGQLARNQEDALMTNREEVLNEVFELALYNDMTYFG